MRELVLPGASISIAASVFPDPAELGRALASEILARVAGAAGSARRFFLGCPGGRSLRTTYRALGEQAEQSGADLSSLVIVMMDEYVFPSEGGFAYCAADAHYSCRRYAAVEIVAQINRALPDGRRICEDNVWFPDPAEPAAYDERLRRAGGVDLFLVASGASDGHVAFNPPGSLPASRTRIVRLADSTRRDNMATFPEFRDLAEVPQYGVSVGIGTIVQLSTEVILVIHGSHKSEAVSRLAHCKTFDPEWPASLIYLSPSARVYLDESAAAGMEVR